MTPTMSAEAHHRVQREIEALLGARLLGVLSEQDARRLSALFDAESAYLTASGAIVSGAE